MRNEQTTSRETPTWLSTREMADRLKLHTKTILKLARAGRIPCLRAGRAIRFDPRAVEDALAQRR